MPGFIDITGQRFGRWLVLERASNNKRDQARWLCRCDCGRKKVVQGCDLRNGHSKGCRNCQTKRKSITHGQEGTRLYHIWNDMIQRCENPNLRCYRNYGGRGISVCWEWYDAATFLKWALENGYEKGLTIDRINNDGDYEPENCQWITRSENTQKAWHIDGSHGKKHLIAL